MRSEEEFRNVETLLLAGVNDCAISRMTRVPRSTIKDWRNGEARTLLRQGRPCSHDFRGLPSEAYCYLLGLYLGDGYIAPRDRGVWRLRITLDALYPGIVEEARLAVNAVMPGQEAHVYQRRTSRCVEVGLYSKHWPCLLPQHGPGRKHERSIVLASWQQDLIETGREALVRGLIHSDGCRLVATERKGAYKRRAARYAFKNLSADILGIFTTACDALGVGWTRSSRTQVSIYRKASVARLDEFVGPKR